MKKKAVPFLVVLLMPVLIGSLIAFVVLAGAIKKKSETECPDGSTGAAATSYTGDVGAIRPPWVGAATYTSKFGMRVNPGNLWKGQVRMHEGVDIAETPSPTVVVSATKGTFKRNWTSAEGANVAEVDVGGGTVLQYVHLASFAPGHKPGDPVWPGEPLGQEGSTGNGSGPHLHFGVMVNGKPTEPWAWLKQHGFKGAPDPGAEGTVLPVGPPAVTSKPKDAGSATAQPAADFSSSSPAQASSSSNSGGDSAGGSVAASEVELPATTGPGQEFSSNPPAPIPSNYLSLYQSAGKKYGIPWQLLAGIGMAETGHGRINQASSAGALGPMQFMPASWAQYGVDGDGDGKKDIMNPADEIPGAARLLVAGGATKGQGGIKSAIFGYNHSQEYVNSVVSYIKFYAGGKAKISAANGGDISAATGCDVSSGGAGGNTVVGDTHASTGYEKAAVAAAQSQLGQKYVWGGGNRDGATGGGFDCSGLALYVVAQATKKSGKELDLPHQSNEQHTSRDLATIAHYSGSGTPDFSTMRPGDVIVFNSPSAQDRHPWNHVGIYIGNEQMIHAPNFGKPVAVDKVSAMGPGEWDAMRPKNQYTGGSST